MSRAQKKMTMDGTYKIDLSNKLKFGGLSEQKIIDIMKNDARLVGNLMDAFLCDEFSNVTVEFDDVSDKPMIRIDDGAEWWVESRVVGKTHANISPSKMLGCSREIKARKRKEWLNTLHGFILTDTSNFPVITIKVVSMDYIGYDTERVNKKLFDSYNTKEIRESL